MVRVTPLWTSGESPVYYGTMQRVCVPRLLSTDVHYECATRTKATITLELDLSRNSMFGRLQLAYSTFSISGQ